MSTETLGVDDSSAHGAQAAGAAPRARGAQATRRAYAYLLGLLLVAPCAGGAVLYASWPERPYDPSCAEYGCNVSLQTWLPVVGALALAPLVGAALVGVLTLAWMRRPGRPPAAPLPQALTASVVAVSTVGIATVFLLAAITT